MSRKRMIDPGIWQSEQIGTLSRDARLLFIGMISNADDEGRLKGSPRYLKATIFPYDEKVTSAKVQQWRDSIAAAVDGTGAAPIRVYEVAGMEYVDMPNWGKYQKVDHPQVSVLPPFPERSPNDTRTFAERSRQRPPKVEEVSLVESSLGESDSAAATRAPAREEAPSSAEPPGPLKTFDQALRRLPGYDPSDAFYCEVLEHYSELDLDQEAVKIESWLRTRPRKRCSVKFVLSWLKRASEPGPTKGNGNGNGGFSQRNHI